MTSEGERSEPSKKASGERSEPRGSEDDRRESSEESSGEQSDPRDSEGERSEPSEESSDPPSDEPRADGSGADEIPLDIAGHDGERPRDADAADGAGLGDPTNSDGNGDGVLSAVDASTDGDGDDEVEPVELLVQLAEEGEIDPWDIDVVRVTDKFLDRLDEADIRTGGRALFYASVLLRMKSDAMWADEPEEPEEPDEFDEPAEPWEAEPPGEAPGAGVDPFDQLEREVERRIERKRARGTPETLDELVRDLRERERDSWWKESRSYDTSGSPSEYDRGTRTLDYRAGDDFRMDAEPTADDVTGTAHDEHMEDIVNDVYVALQARYDGGRDEVLFAEVREAGGSVVDTFLGLLFLAHRGRVRLEQDDCFGDLWIQDPAAVGTEGTAAADD
ncbi:segregation/condensation protein A [Halobacteriales archaeon QS_4_69_225]|nr:MAG: segregation/condensation protein A [Halobacteriales archaeon QS_4_69_225]